LKMATGNTKKSGAKAEATIVVKVTVKATA
jgi:hypothetical protein